MAFRTKQVECVGTSLEVRNEVILVGEYRGLDYSKSKIQYDNLDWFCLFIDGGIGIHSIFIRIRYDKEYNKFIKGLKIGDRVRVEGCIFHCLKSKDFGFIDEIYMHTIEKINNLNK